MKRKKASLIPEKAQVPVMVGGSIVLVLILAWQFLPLGTPPAPSAAAAPPAAVVPSATPATPVPGAAPGLPTADGTVAALEALIAEAQKSVSGVAPVDAGLPPLASNPFSPLLPVSVDPDEPPPGMTAEEWAVEEGGTDEPPEEAMTQEEEEAPTMEEIDRQYRLASLNLTGTIKTGAWAMAVINDGYYRAGQVVEGFTVAEIKEKEVVLRDAQGDSTLHLEYNDEVSTPLPRRAAEVHEDAPPESEEPETLEPVETSISIGDSGF